MTAQDLITAALREGNLIAVSETPSTAELTQALGRLNGYIASLFGIEIGEHLSDWLVPVPQRTAPVAANFPQLPYPLDVGPTTLPLATDLTANISPYPPQNSRLVVKITDDTTVYFPEQPDDGARMSYVDVGSDSTLTLDGNGRTIESAATKDVTSADTGRKWFFRADLGDWKLVADLALTDSSPFPAEFDDLLICGLSVRLSPRYGQEPRGGTVQMLQYMMKNFKTRYRQSGTTIFGSQDIPNSYQSYRSGSWMW